MSKLANQNTKIEQISETKCQNNESQDLANTDKQTVATTRDHPLIRPMEPNFDSNRFPANATRKKKRDII